MDAAQIAALLTAQIAQYGSPITISRGGVDTTYTVMTDHANNEVIETYFDANDAAGLTHPVMVIYLDATCSGTNNPPKNLDSFTYNGRNYSVALNAAPFSMSGEVILYVTLAD
jgi:hypothetical protein